MKQTEKKGEEEKFKNFIANNEEKEEKRELIQFNVGREKWLKRQEFFACKTFHLSSILTSFNFFMKTLFPYYVSSRKMVEEEEMKTWNFNSIHLRRKSGKNDDIQQEKLNFPATNIRYTQPKTLSQLLARWKKMTKLSKKHNFFLSMLIMPEVS